MKNQFIAIIAFAAFLLASCDDTTDTLGGSLTNKMDKLEISADTFMVSTRSIAADSVLSRTTIGYLGKIKDTETGGYITGNYMTQFRIPENYAFPSAQQMTHKINDIIVADSCEIRLYYATFYGDSLAPMKVTAYAMSKPMNEDRKYYSNFDPIKQGYVSPNAYQVDKIYTLTDAKAQAGKSNNGNSSKYITIKLNQPYTAPDGKEYNNFGTYVLQRYYQHPAYFKNSFSFAQHVVPGFYLKNASGLGSIVYINLSQLNIYFTFKHNNKEQVGSASFSGTEEVLQTSNISNDAHTIQSLVNNHEHTYLKSPAGIFTELTIPVDEILKGHEKDSLNAAKIHLARLNNLVNSKYALDIPQTLLLVQKDSLYSFFENKRIADYKTSFLATYNAANNGYTFHNIGSVIKEMKKNKMAGTRSKDWNKLVVIPVQATYYSYNQNKILTRVVHDMSLTSTRLLGGNQPLSLSVIYSHFQ